jgi:hypothetical protein
VRKQINTAARPSRTTAPTATLTPTTRPLLFDGGGEADVDGVPGVCEGEGGASLTGDGGGTAGEAGTPLGGGGEAGTGTEGGGEVGTISGGGGEVGTPLGGGWRTGGGGDGVGTVSGGGEDGVGTVTGGGGDGVGTVTGGGGDGVAGCGATGGGGGGGDGVTAGGCAGVVDDAGGCVGGTGATGVCGAGADMASPLSFSRWFAAAPCWCNYSSPVSVDYDQHQRTEKRRPGCAISMAPAGRRTQPVCDEVACVRFGRAGRVAALLRLPASSDSNKHSHFTLKYEPVFVHFSTRAVG